MTYFNPNKPLLFFTYIKALRLVNIREVPTICPAFRKLLSLNSIDESEYEIVTKHLRANKPSRDKFREVFYHPYFTGSAKWWEVEYESQSKIDEIRCQRIRYLGELIRSVIPNPLELIHYWITQLCKIMNIFIKKR